MRSMNSAQAVRSSSVTESPSTRVPITRKGSTAATLVGNRVTPIRPERAVACYIARAFWPLLDAFRDWAQMGALPESMRAAIESTVRVKAKAYESGGTLTIPNPAILVSAVK